MSALKPIVGQQAVAQIFQRLDLTFTERARFQRREGHFTNALGGVTHGEQISILGMHPTEETGQGSQVIVDGRRCETFIVESLLPGQYITLNTGIDAFLSITILEKGLEAIQVQVDFLSDRFGTNANHGHLQVVHHP
nr:hypothetical protein [Anaerolineae bacterium]